MTIGRSPLRLSNPMRAIRSSVTVLAIGTEVPKIQDFCKLRVSSAWNLLDGKSGPTHPQHCAFGPRGPAANLVWLAGTAE